jgi:hypothetical protein
VPEPKISLARRCRRLHPRFFEAAALIVKMQPGSRAFMWDTLVVPLPSPILQNNGLAQTGTIANWDHRNCLRHQSHSPVQRFVPAGALSKRDTYRK